MADEFDRFIDKKTRKHSDVYFRYIVWRDLMNQARHHHLCGYPAQDEPGSYWNSDRGSYRLHNQKMAAEYYRAARKIMDIE
jgi:hypothetical protein